jgi:DNA mismatch repair protein MutL
MDDDQILALSNLGFIISFNDNCAGESAVVQCIPDMLRMLSPQEVIASILSLSRGNVTIDDAAAALACRTAIKNGTVLSFVQMRNIVSGLMGCTCPHVCPHGRPIFLELGHRDLSTIFQRRYIPQRKNAANNRRVHGRLAEDT